MMTPEDRASWATAYHIYEEYAPRLQRAAHDPDRAAEIFAQAFDSVTRLYETDHGYTRV